MKDPLTDFELDRLELARCNSHQHRVASPHKRVLQLAFEDIEYTRAEGRERLADVRNRLSAEVERKHARKTVLRQLITDIENTREMMRRPCRVERKDEFEGALRETQ
jgi:hypothetical protein